MPVLKNPKMERFAQMIFSSNASPRSIAWRRELRVLAEEFDTNPSNIRVWSARPDIIARVEELKNMSARETVASIARRREVLTQILESEMAEPITASARIAAVAELNRMDGIYDEARRAPEYPPGSVEVNILVMDGETKAMVKSASNRYLVEGKRDDRDD